MKSLLFVLVCLLSGASFAQSYADLALKYTSQMKRIIDSKIDLINEQTQPIETKQLRKDIGQLKIYLDLFIYSYKYKKWDQVRSQLDQGYEYIGDFKDLNDTSFGAQIDQVELERLRSKVLIWTSLYQANDETEFFESASDEYKKREKSELPKYIWRRVKFKPSNHLSGKDNIKAMLRELLIVTRDDLKEIMDFKNLFKYEREDKFHDFRKSIRTILKIISSIEEIDPAYQEIENYKVLQMTIDQMGDLNDYLVALHKAKDKEDKAKIKKFKKEIKKRFKVIKDFIEVRDVDSHIKMFSKMLEL